MRGEEDCSVTVGFEVDSAIEALGFVMEVLYAGFCTRHGDFLSTLVLKKRMRYQNFGKVGG